MTNTNEQSGDAVNLTHSCRLPLATSTINYVADLLRKHLKAIGSRWRSRTAGQIAVLVLAVLRHDQRAADLAGGNQVSATTVIALLAAKAPRLDRAPKNARPAVPGPHRRAREPDLDLLGPPGARPARSRAPGTTGSASICAPPAWGPWPTSASPP